MLNEPLEIIYQDEHLVAINKPAGLLVHKSHVDKYENLNAMHLLRDQLGQWVYPLHRLDKPTSGVLLFALDPGSAKQMGEQFEQKVISKTYLAITRGYVELEGVIDYALKPVADFKSDKKRIAQKEAQEAKTAYKCLKQVELLYAVDKYPSSRYSLVELYPETGRKHQLRRHLKHINHPIIGDPRYGKSVHNRFFQSQFDCRRLLLASTQLQFMHPVNNEQITIKAGIGEEFSKVLGIFD